MIVNTEFNILWVIAKLSSKKIIAANMLGILFDTYANRVLWVVFLKTFKASNLLFRLKRVIRSH